MNHVLLLTLEYPPDRGGVATYLHALHSELVNCRVARAEMGERWPRWRPTIAQARRLIRDHRINFLAVSHVLPLGYVTLVLRVLWNIPYVVFVHGLDVLRAAKNPWKRWWLRRILSRARHVVANSEFTSQLVQREGLSADRVTVLTPCVESVPTITPLPEKPTILSVGRLVPRKNHRAVIEVLPELLREFTGLQYVVLGDGPERQSLELLANQLGVSSAVQFLGAVSDEERYEWYRRAYLFALPTYSEGDDVEGFGIVFLEAASFGRPVVAGRGGGVEEAVRDGETGLVVDPHSREELRVALKKLIADRSYAARLGQAGYDRVTREFVCAPRRATLARIYGFEPET